MKAYGMPVIVGQSDEDPYPQPIMQFKDHMPICSLRYTNFLMSLSDAERQRKQKQWEKLANGNKHHNGNNSVQDNPGRGRTQARQTQS